MPKELSHTLLFILGAALLLAILWLKPNKQQMMAHPGFIEVLDIKTEGLRLRDHDQNFAIDDPRLTKLSSTEIRRMKILLVGKFMKRAEGDLVSPLKLPIEFFDPLCFSESTLPIKNLNCPTVVINP